jgi:PAS domain S-box-containing protein
MEPFRGPSWVNRTAADLLGYSVDEVIGRSAVDFLDPDWDPVAFESIVTALGAEGPRQPMLFRVIAADGSKAIWEVTANAQFHDSVLNGMVVYARPWTERWLLDQTLDATAQRLPTTRHSVCW